VADRLSKVCNVCENQFGQPSERCLAFVSPFTGEVGREFLAKRGIPSRVVNLRVRNVLFSTVFFDASAYLTLRLYWQHAGWNMSSRLAEHVLEVLREDPGALHSLEGNDQSLCRTKSDFAGDHAKDAIRKRIAGFLSEHRTKASSPISDGDVFLYPTGMAAIWTAHDTCLKALGDRPTVCFG
jgi:cystathionine gamma-synthase